MTPPQKGLLCGVLLAVALPVGAVVDRGIATVGEIVRIKGDEEVRFVDLPTWRVAEVEQTLAPGDTLRTGPFGGLAILFQDETQIRVHRNTLMVIKDIRQREVEGSTTTLQLLVGSVWTRAQRLLHAVTQQETVKMETPSATIGIRGTDWSASVDDQGQTTLIVLSGSARFSNAYGEVTVERGELATAELGQAPTKRLVVDLKDRPLLVLEFSLDWFDALSITGEPPRVLKSLRSTPQAGAALQALEQAEYAYDLHEYEMTAELLRAFDSDLTAAVDPTGELAARAELVRGLLKARAHDYETADSLFRSARKRLSGRLRIVADLGIVAALIQRNRFGEAQEALDRLSLDSSPYVEVQLFQAALLSVAGEHAKAVEVARGAKTRFPKDARAPAMLSSLYLLTDDRSAMKRAIDEAIVLDPENQAAWHNRGLYYHWVEPNAERALESYRRSVEINGRNAASWNNLGLVYLDLGDLEASAAAIQKAISLEPRLALPIANQASLLAVLDRFDEAQQQYDRALKLEPGHPESYVGRGLLLVQRGNPAEGAEEILKGIAADPSAPGAYTALAVAYYQSGRFADAQAAIDQARTFDPNDPVAPFVGSMMAQDQARAAEAVALAQEALRKARKFGSFAVEGIANTQNGLNNVGSAYGNLGLSEWGNYYANLSFSPYNPSGYFFLSQFTGYPSASARVSSGGQGLLLDPTAVSFPTRYVEFLREPRRDVTIGAGAGDEGGAKVYSVAGSLQGFVRAPDPVAYNFSFVQNRNDGFRENTRIETEGFTASVGTRFDDRKQNVLFRLFAYRSKRGLPGASDNSDSDDEQEFEQFGFSIGYQRRIAFDNRILARLSAGTDKSTLNNPAPLGTGWSDRDVSLVNFLGFGGTNAVYNLGLYGAFPVFVFGPAGAILGLPQLSSTIPARFDANLIRRQELESSYFSLQFRQLLTVGAVDATYGFEWLPIDSRSTTRVDQFASSSLAVLSDFTSLSCFYPLFFTPFGSCLFPFGSLATSTVTQDTSMESAQAYAQALWKVTPEVSVEAGLYLRHLGRTGFEDKTELDPRIGAGWQISPQEWLRIAWQRELRLPSPPDGSLAPVGVVGLVIPDAFSGPGESVRPIIGGRSGTLQSFGTEPVQSRSPFAFVGFGGSAESLQARWDAEWTRRVYSFVSVEEQRLENLNFFNPYSFVDAYLGGPIVTKGVWQRFAAGTNVWLGGNLGLNGIVQLQWSENESGGPDDGRDLPFFPAEKLQAGVTWVFPNQLRVDVAAVYTGERWGNLANTVKLGGYWTANANVLWQPFQKHVALNLTLLNFFDKSFEVAPGFPGPGRSAYLTAEYRF